MKNKKVLITAGPTWAPVDDVRVLSNISTGELGLLLAAQAKRRGYRVDLLLGPVGDVKPQKGVRLLRFAYFHELLRLVKRQLSVSRYDVILHAAAVSDYLAPPSGGKISSRKEKFVLRLRRAPKIIGTMRRLNPKALLVMFKLESRVSDAVLLRRAAHAREGARADLAVANMFSGGSYRGYVLNGCGILSKSASKKQLAKRLFAILEHRLVK